MNETCKSVLHRRADGSLVEYRRVDDLLAEVWHVEGRVLKADGTPHDGRWNLVSDQWFAWLGRHTDVLDLLNPR